MGKARRWTAALAGTVILAAVLMGAVPVPGEENETKEKACSTEKINLDAESREYLPSEDPESLYRNTVLAKERYEAMEQAAAEKYGKDYIAIEEGTLVPERSVIQKEDAGESIYTQVLKQNAVGITIVQYYEGGGYEVKENWNEGILGTSSGRMLYCADPVKGFQEGYKKGVPGTDYFSEYTIDFVAAVFYYCDHYMCKAMSGDQEYIIKQIAFWHFANFSKNWFPGCYFDFSANYYCGCGRNLFEHRTELLDGAGLEWANANYDKMDAVMTVYEGDGQPLMELDYEYHPTGKMKLKKVSEDQKSAGESIRYSLKGAEYGVYRDAACTDLKSTLITDENGETQEIEVDVGTWYIKELAAPEGYLLDPKIHKAEAVPGQTVEVKVSDRLSRLELVKVFRNTGKTVPGVGFRHIFPDGSEEQAATNQDGKIVLEGLRWGTHIIEEISTPDGISKNPGKLEFIVDKDGSITVSSNTSTEEDGLFVLQENEDGTVSVTVEDVPAPYELEVHKENEKGKKLTGAEFTLYLDRECTRELQKAVSDEGGRIIFTDLKVETKYYLRETKAPAGFQLPAEEDGSPVIYEIYTKSDPMEGIFEYYVNGALRTDISGTKAERKVELTVVNQIGMKLPKTGTGGAAAIWLSGIMFMAIPLLAGVISQRQGKGRL